ncbi:MAG: DegT/DnrJ/EryC1/StrS family aminotransferase [Planctomycetota bacterium]|nr:DegT/DnrJ/EryC1/StrS family aminotransferase [Planctomycetota bacterium]
MTRVPLLDLTRSDPDTDAALRAAFERVLGSGQFVMGPDVGEMECECAGYIGSMDAIGVSSGTDALILALMALGVGAGDEVVCPTYTFFATAGAVWRLGAKPVFVDVDPATFNVTPEALEAAITPRTKALMPVHLFGQSADLDGIEAVAARHGVPVVEDAAQAIGARWGARGVGTVGAFGCFSFFPTKNLGCLGDGGLVTTADPDLGRRARILRVHGMDPKYYHQEVGGNFRIDTLQAAFVRVRLAGLDAATERRRRNAAGYRERFAAAGLVRELGDDAPGGLVLPLEVDPSHTYNQFVVRVTGAQGERDRLRAFLHQEGVGCEVYYPVPLHLQACFAALGHGEGAFPVAEKAAAESLALPIFPGLTDSELDCVVDRIAAYAAARA